MSKFDAALEKYSAQLRTILPEDQIDDFFLRSITRDLGPTIYHRDASLVSTSDPKELELIKNRHLIGKLGYEDNQELDSAILSVCELMKGHRQKHRAVFYYLLHRALGLVPSGDESAVYYDAYVYLGTLAETPSGDKDVPVYISLDPIACVYTQHVDFDDSETPEGQRSKDILDRGSYSYDYDEKWGDIIIVESKLYGKVYYQLTESDIRQLNNDRTEYAGFEASRLTGGDVTYYSGTLQGEKEVQVQLYANFVTQTYIRYATYITEEVPEGEPADLSAMAPEAGTFETIAHDEWGVILKFTPLEGETSVFVVADDGHLQELSPDLTETRALVLDLLELPKDYCSA